MQNNQPLLSLLKEIAVKNQRGFDSDYLMEQAFIEQVAAIRKLLEERVLPEESKKTALELNLSVDKVNFNDKAEAECYQWGYNECRQEVLDKIRSLE